ncbi:right-handed parallel beta-helix repeat-containing protein [Streptomyces sp. NPDC021224]|uniref:right-handed parallel beta-helix repeat-containing protein n=1 Tax=unclassified Streptomyces TaxID=2593676 RepID=UPI0037AF2810
MGEARSRSTAAARTAVRRLAYGLTAALPAAALLAGAHTAGAAGAPTYYIDNSASSQCSDTGPGTSPTRPWCDFAPINGTSLTAGTQVLLARGDTWTQPLRLSGSGTAAAWITLGAYGSGNRPVISGSGNATDRTVVLTDPDHWHVQDLELRNAGEGLLVMYSTLGHQGLDVHGVYAHDLAGIVNRSPVQSDFPQLQYSTGILVDASSAPVTAAGQTVVNGVSIRDNEVGDAVAAIHVNDDPGVTGTPDPAPSTFTGVDVVHNYLHHMTGPSVSLETSDTAHVDSNYIDCSGSVWFPQGTTCFFVTKSDHPTIQNNVLVNMPDTGSHDETAIDLEYKINGAAIRDNYFGNNAGSAIEMLQLGGRSGDYSTGTEISDNTFAGNGTAGAQSMKGQIAVHADGGTTPPAASIHDNAYDATPQGLVNDVDGSPELANITQSGNTVTTAQYVAPLPFNGEQGRGGWSQQAYDLSSWQNLTAYDAATNTWSGLGGSFVNAFQLRPGSGQTSDAWVARTWTAPATGTVTVHGRIFKDDADNAADTDGVHALIEHNGTAVWPSAPDYVTYRTLAPTDRSGYATDVTLQVTAGDVIRFVLTSDPGFSGTGDTTSWSPSVSYTS